VSGAFKPRFELARGGNDFLAPARAVYVPRHQTELDLYFDESKCFVGRLDKSRRGVLLRQSDLANGSREPLAATASFDVLRVQLSRGRFVVRA